MAFVNGCKLGIPRQVLQLFGIFTVVVGFFFAVGGPVQALRSSTMITRKFGAAAWAVLARKARRRIIRPIGHIGRMSLQAEFEGGLWGGFSEKVGEAVGRGFQFLGFTTFEGGFGVRVCALQPRFEDDF